MRKNPKRIRLLFSSFRWYFPLVFSVACTTRGPLKPGAPRPTPQHDSVLVLHPALSASGSWSFRYQPGILQYRISRNAVIESRSDSALHREISTNLTHETIALEGSGDTIRVTATIDTFTVTTQGIVGSVQPVELPVRAVGGIIGNSLTISEPSVVECSAASSALMTDLHSLLSPFPPQLSSGTSWRDSTDTSSCQAGIPTTSHQIRTYLVSGQITYDGQPVVIIQRADTIRAHGEGAQQQHHISLEASGTGSAVYYLSPVLGRVIRLTTEQELNLTVTASSRVLQFRQSSRQEFSLAP